MKQTIKSTIAISMLALAIGSTQVSAADVTLTIPAGLACLNFDLTINIDVNDKRVYREFTDKDGQTVRIIDAGKGNDLEFVNDATGATFALQGNGSVSHTTVNPDGTSTVSAEGHNVIILFPTDVPPGPTTTQYVGRVVYEVDTDGVFTLQEVRGRTVDICAALSE